MNRRKLLGLFGAAPVALAVSALPASADWTGTPYQTSDGASATMFTGERGPEAIMPLRRVALVTGPTIDLNNGTVRFPDLVGGWSYVWPGLAIHNP